MRKLMSSSFSCWRSLSVRYVMSFLCFRCEIGHAVPSMHVGLGNGMPSQHVCPFLQYAVVPDDVLPHASSAGGGGHLRISHPHLPVVLAVQTGPPMLPSQQSS